MEYFPNTLHLSLLTNPLLPKNPTPNLQNQPIPHEKNLKNAKKNKKNQKKKKVKPKHLLEDPTPRVIGWKKI